jgi:methionyl-tRNA synthetase
VVAPSDFVAQYGLDQVRFFFLREVPFGADGSYNHEAIVGRMNSDLANNFGNLAQRSLSMVAKNCEGRVPVPGDFTAEDTALLAQANGLLDAARAAFEKQEFSRALETIWGVLGDTNAYFAEQAPWVLRKTDVERMNTVLYVTLEVVRIVAILVQPVMPGSAAQLLDALGQPEGEARQFARIASPIESGTSLPAPKPVFPKYEEPAEA